MAGGILGHLAREVVDNATICRGSTENVIAAGGLDECLYSNRDSEGYWDDQLTEDEVNLICGMYEITTGELDKFEKILVI
ncbi:hypothetical protein Moror_3595 [Moniliophthora roreri MCA 2997]|uniref:Uncharacterized protein n=2 Tax=Moniliophthora roreri TaxID=221103 RepID=V2WU91_MONRO|nr:hypothetical protein Moror_3595 [Moniliophthora roreri MCA 2997]